jgi:glycosyltransferase involved in cell wall biosynthesis
MQPASKISVIVTTYNRPDALMAVIEACLAQDDPHYEIIIADDGSTNNTRDCVEALRRRAPVPLLHVWQPDDGFRAARVRNLGTLAASGDYIVFLDGDCIPARNFVSQHRRLARRGFIVSGSRVLLSEDYTRTLLDARIDLHALGAVDRLRLRLAGHFNKFLQTVLVLPDVGRERRKFSWRRIKSCNLAVWRSDLDRVNGFDESFTGWGHEDSDLVVRLFNAGVLRKDGAFATEVYHLWHRENRRDQATSNRKVVLERAADGTTRAVSGLQELAAAAWPQEPPAQAPGQGALSKQVL